MRRADVGRREDSPPCSLHVLTGMRSGFPEAGYLLDCLVDYALTDTFTPKSEPLAFEEAKQVFKTP